MNARTSVLLLAILASCTALGDVTITPLSPSLNDTVTIHLENRFGAQANATSATITRAGNTFIIQQNVDLACSLPSDPLVASQFDVGPLTPGTYNINANIVFNGLGFPNFPCSREPITQTAAFVVTPSVPVVGPWLLLLMALTLAISGATLLRRL